MTRRDDLPGEPELLTVRGEINMCAACLDGAGGECHTPGCLFWIVRAPDLPLRDRLAEIFGCTIGGPGEAPRWVPVTERLPETADPSSGYSKEVLCFTDGNCQCVGFYQRTGEWLLYDMDRDGLQVTHWRELPEGPKP